MGVGLENMPWLSVTIFLPAVGALLLLLPWVGPRGSRLISLVFTSITAVVSVALAVAFNGSSSDFQLADAPGRWLPAWDLYYRVAVDGISIWLLPLTTILSLVAVLGAWSSIRERVRVFFFCLLLLETAMLGVFAATDLFLFYVFWEGMLIPMYFIIGIWGGRNRAYAAMKFILYTLTGGVLMLAGILLLYYSLPTADRTFEIPRLMVLAPQLSFGLQAMLFVLFGIAFAIKVPMFPFHTWLPDAHVEAPTSGSVILAGVMLKLGAYGFIRICLGFLPLAAEYFAPAMMWLAVIGIVYGGAAAMWQKDIKRLVAYSSVSHLGFVMLGIFAFTSIGLQGAIMQMVSHGFSTGALFLLVGMVYERRHTRMIDDYRGLWEEMPVYSRVFLVVALSSIGLPGLNGFVGEFLTLLGTFASDHAQALLWAALAATGVIIAACYLLWMFKRVFYGEPDTEREGFPMDDMRLVELVPAIILLAGIVGLGVYPRPVLAVMKPAAEAVIERVEGAVVPAPDVEMLDLENGGESE